MCDEPDGADQLKDPCSILKSVWQHCAAVPSSPKVCYFFLSRSLLSVKVDGDEDDGDVLKVKDGGL